MSEALLTIIIPVYKTDLTFLRICLNSIKAQTSHHWKAILIDDGSPDDCGKECDEYARSDSRFLVIHQENKGVSAARNVGIDLAETEWVTFVDPDDWVEPDWIERLEDTLKTIGCYDIICYDYWREFSNKSKLENVVGTSIECSDSLLDSLRNAPFYKLIVDGHSNPYASPAIWNKIYRRSFIENNKLRFILEAKKAQDRLFNARALQCSDRIYYLHQPFYHYRCSSESITNRYNPEIVVLTQIQLNELYRIITQFNMGETTRRYLNARICTRLYSCMRLYYFHPQNQNSTSEQIAAARDVLNSEPFASALKTVDVSLLNKKELVFVMCMKFGFLHLCRLMVRAKAKRFSQTLQ